MPSKDIPFYSESSVIYIFPIYLPITGNSSPDLWAKSLNFEKKKPCSLNHHCFFGQDKSDIKLKSRKQGFCCGMLSTLLLFYYYYFIIQLCYYFNIHILYISFISCETRFLL